SVNIHLPQFFGEDVHVIVAVDLFDTTFPKVGLFIIARRYCEEIAVLIIGRGNEYVELFGKTKAPSIVGGIAEVFEMRCIRIELVHTGAEPERLAPDSPFKTGIPNRTPNFVVHSIP